jgi:hypothetical protein
MVEKLLDNKLEDTRASLSSTLIGVATIFVAVAAFGAIADKVFGSEEKAQEARKLGYDV